MSYFVIAIWGLVICHAFATGFFKDYRVQFMASYTALGSPEPMAQYGIWIVVLFPWYIVFAVYVWRRYGTWENWAAKRIMDMSPCSTRSVTSFDGDA